jgi:GWxTD domain-containing protein
MSFSGLARSFTVGVLICSCSPSFAQTTAPKNRADISAAQSQNIPGNTPVLYDAWLEEDVRWLITDGERAAFKRLSNDAERDNFIEAFWGRRDPTPETAENEFEGEFYRRIAYANEHFRAGASGSNTDRGHVYVLYGPPDKIESYSPGDVDKGAQSGDADNGRYPREVWRYGFLGNLGYGVSLRFADTCHCGDCRLSVDDASKAILFQPPQALWIAPGYRIKPDRDGLTMVDVLGRPPQVRFRDLEEIVSHKINVTMVPFSVRTDSLRLTTFTALVRITI